MENLSINDLAEYQLVDLSIVCDSGRDVNARAENLELVIDGLTLHDAVKALFSLGVIRVKDDYRKDSELGLDAWKALSNTRLDVTDILKAVKMPSKKGITKVPTLAKVTSDTSRLDEEDQRQIFEELKAKFESEKK